MQFCLQKFPSTFIFVKFSELIFVYTWSDLLRILQYILNYEICAAVKSYTNKFKN